MITVNLLCRKIKGGKAYSIYLRYYDRELGKIIGSETLDLDVSKNYFGRGENAVERILAKDKEKMQLAENILTHRKAEILGERFSIALIDNKKKKVSVMEEIRKAAEEKQHRTYTAMYKHFKLYMNGATEINEDCVQKFQTFLLNHKKTNDTNLSQTSVHHYMTRLQIILAELRTKGVIAQQIKVNIVKEDRKESVYLSIDEIQRVMDAEIDEKYRVIQYAYLFSCFTGLRRSDIINLKWQDVFGDFLKIQTIKTKSYEEIALPETALYILSLLKNDGGSVFNFVMCNLRKAFDHIAEKADIKKVVRFHSSRHTFGTVLFEAGVDIYTVQRLLTHKSIASTMIYAHIKNADKKRAVDKLPNLKMKT